MTSRRVTVSVPCRGTTFLNGFHCELSGFPADCFRPLSGNYISQSYYANYEESDEKFPSPVGELHFSIENPFVRSSKERVSVPCRGTTFLNGFVHLKELGIIVSVPCRGTTFLNGEFSHYEVQDHLFPSPVGELHFSIKTRGAKKMKAVFPSPVGELHFSIRTCSLQRKIGNAVSVPCRGTTFLNTIPTIPPPVWAHGRDCVGKIFLEK